MGGPAGHATIGHASPGGHGGGQGGGQGGVGVPDPVWSELATQGQAIIGQASPALQGGGHGGGHAIITAFELPRDGPPAVAVGLALLAGHGGQGVAGHDAPGGQGGGEQGGSGHRGAMHGGGVHLDPFAQGSGQDGVVGAPLRGAPPFAWCFRACRPWCRRWWRR